MLAIEDVLPVAEKDLSALAAQLKKLRDALGISQQELAHRAGLSMSVVARLEQGAKLDPRMSTLARLARGLEVNIGELVGGWGPTSDTPKKKK